MQESDKAELDLVRSRAAPLNIGADEFNSSDLYIPAGAIQKDGLFANDLAYRRERLPLKSTVLKSLKWFTVSRWGEFSAELQTNILANPANSLTARKHHSGHELYYRSYADYCSGQTDDQYTHDPEYRPEPHQAKREIYLCDEFPDNATYSEPQPGTDQRANARLQQNHYAQRSVRFPHGFEQRVLPQIFVSKHKKHDSRRTIPPPDSAK